MDRRTLMKWGLRTIGAATAGMMGVPVAVTLLAPARRPREPLWRPVGPLDGFSPGSVTPAVVEVPQPGWTGAVERKAVYVWRPVDQEVVVFSRSCTDLGCPVRFDPGSQWFFCPCHGGIFGTDGSVRAGPPNRPLDRFAHRVVGGRLEIDLRSLSPIS
jgi:menaquinol-cytochrome c reductase iron-sulfur subunit